MIRIKPLTLLTATFVLASLLPIGMTQAAAAVREPQQRQTQAEQPTRQEKQQVEHPGAPQVFTGRVIEKAGAYILIDPAAKMTYDLDNQHEASQFKNKRVNVEGTLDAASNTIHVITIRRASKS